MKPGERVEVRVGVISDTHGLIRPEALDALVGSDIIVHAGDIGDPAVVKALERIAPVHAVRGNVDLEPWARRFPETRAVAAADRSLYVLHDVSRLRVDPRAGEIAAVVFGHSHQPHCERRGEVLYFNPGSAGPRRFGLPVTIGRLRVGPEGITGELVDIVR